MKLTKSQRDVLHLLLEAETADADVKYSNATDSEPYRVHWQPTDRLRALDLVTIAGPNYDQRTVRLTPAGEREARR